MASLLFLFSMGSFIAAFAVAFVCFVLGFGYLFAATVDGRREQLPAHAKFNPLNVLLYPYTLTENGRKLRSRGLKFLAVFFAICLVVVTFGAMTEIAQSVLGR